MSDDPLVEDVPQLDPLLLLRAWRWQRLGTTPLPGGRREAGQAARPAPQGGGSGGGGGGRPQRENGPV